MDERPSSGPAPRWGEYAPTPPSAPAPVEPEAPREEWPPPAAPERVPPTSLRAARPGTAPPWDRLVTVLLLGLGCINVIGGIPAMLGLAQTLDDTYASQGYGHYTSDSLAAAIGIAINVVNVLLLVVAVALSVRRLRSGRLTFWVPLVAGASALIVTIALVSAAMLGDPALPAFLSQQGSGS